MQRKILLTLTAAALLGGATLASEAQAGPNMRDFGGRPGASTIDRMNRSFNQMIERGNRAAERTINRRDWGHRRPQ
jgi:hypothetical protein